jgi:hypothetical protein
MRSILVFLVVCACPPIAVAAVDGGAATQIYEDETGGYPRVGNLSANADGNFVLPVQVESDGTSGEAFRGLILDADGTVVGKPVTWAEEIDGEALPVGEIAAVDATGEQGLASWSEVDLKSDRRKPVLQVFDARTAKPIGEPSSPDSIEGLEALEPYQDGYAGVYSRKISGQVYDVMLQTLDAKGAPFGKPRSLYKGRFGADVALIASPSGTRLVSFEFPYKGPDEITIFKPDGTVKELTLESAGGPSYGIAHASGAAYMLVGQTEEKQLFTQQLTGAGKLKAPRVLGGRPGYAIDVAYSEDGGLLVYRPRGRSACGFVAQELTVSGKPRGATKKLDYDCGAGFVKADVDLEAGEDGRFALAFAAQSGSLDSSLEVDLFGAGLRLR